MVIEAEDMPTACWKALPQLTESTSGTDGLQETVNVVDPYTTGIGSSLVTLVG
jgi:hypothetical protein